MVTTGGASEGSDNVERAVGRAGQVLLWLAGSVGLYLGLSAGFAALFFAVIVGPGSPDASAWLWLAFWLTIVAHQISVVGSTLVLARLLSVPVAAASIVVVVALLILALPTISSALFLFGCATGGSSCFG